MAASSNSKGMKSIKPDATVKLGQNPANSRSGSNSSRVAPATSPRAVSGGKPMGSS